MSSNAVTVEQKIPESLDDVTIEWVQQCLASRSIDDRLKAHSISPIGEGFGQTGIAALISLEYEGADQSGGRRPEALVIKMATPDPARRAVAQTLNLYEREVRFYQTMAKGLKVRVPEDYFAVISEDGMAYALVIEGLIHHRAGDETIGCSPEEAKLAVVQLARLHASNWDSEQARNMDRFPVVERSRLEQGWDQMVADFGHLIPAELLDVREAFLDNFPELAKWVVSEPVTVIHADFKLDNLLFGPPGSADPIVVLDWQAVRPAKGIQDLAYLVGQNMNEDLRRANQDELLADYVAELASLGIVYSLEQAREDYRKATLYLWSYVIMITGLMVNNHERAIRRKTGLVQRAASAILDLDALALLKS